MQSCDTHIMVFCSMTDSYVMMAVP
jgi:hypothetical protein